MGERGQFTPFPHTLPYKHAFLPYAYGSPISLITRVAEDVDPYNINQIFLPTEPSAHEIPSPSVAKRPLEKVNRPLRHVP